MKMPDKIENIMLAPCGMNCMVCYKHVQIRKKSKQCQGCLLSGEGKPEHCHKCKIKECSQLKGYTYCYECLDFPCKQIKNLEKSYSQRYKQSIVNNSLFAKEHGVDEFMIKDKEKWICKICGGAFSLHDNVCSDCGERFL